MFQRFAEAAREAVREAEVIARDRGAQAIEAEHILLAITRRDTPAARVLGDHGLDYEGLDDALRAETVRSLAAVGITADALYFSPFVKSPKFGTSAKVLLERSLKQSLARRDNHIGDEHLALAALEPARGTVPRALELAGVDRAELAAALSARTA